MRRLLNNLGSGGRWHVIPGKSMFLPLVLFFVCFASVKTESFSTFDLGHKAGRELSITYVIAHPRGQIFSSPPVDPDEYLASELEVALGNAGISHEYVAEDVAKAKRGPRSPGNYDFVVLKWFLRDDGTAFAYLSIQNEQVGQRGSHEDSEHMPLCKMGPYRKNAGLALLEDNVAKDIAAELVCHNKLHHNGSSCEKKTPSCEHTNK